MEGLIMLKVMSIPPAYQEITIGRRKQLDKVPEEFYLAAVISYAYSKYKDKEIKAISEMYVPFYFHKVSDGSYIVFENIVHLTPTLEDFEINKNLDRLINMLNDKQTEDSIHIIMDEIVNLYVKFKNITIEGLNPPVWINELSQVIGHLEEAKDKDFSFILEPEDWGDLREKGKSMFIALQKKTKESTNLFDELIKMLDEQVEQINRKIDLEIEMWAGRYDAELLETKEEVEKRIKELEDKKREEINKILQWRDYNLWYYRTYFNDTTSSYVQNIKQQADYSVQSIEDRYNQLINVEHQKLLEIERRKKSVLDPIYKRKNLLNSKYTSVKEKLQFLRDRFENMLNSYEHFVIKLKNENSDAIQVLIPLYVILLEDSIEVLPVSVLDTKSKAGVFKKFSFPFRGLNDFWTTFASTIEHRLKVHLKLNAFIAKEATKKNVLSSNTAYKIFQDNFDLLVTRKFAKKDLKKSIEQIFTIVEEKREEEVVAPKAETELAVTRGSEIGVVGDVVIQITDEEGKPIPDAKIHLNGSNYDVDLSGNAYIKKTAGIYSVKISAEGYKQREETIQIYPEAYTTYKFELEKISDIEIIISKIPELLTLAKKFGINSIAVEEKIKELSEKHNINPKKIWRELYSSLIRTWYNSGMKKEAIEAAILYLTQEAKSRGGIMPLAEVVISIQSMGLMVSRKDVEKVINELVKEKIIQGIQEVSGVKMVFFVSSGWSGDTRRVLELAAKHGGELTREQIILETGWSEDYTELILKNLEESGIATSGTTKGKKVWWFPALYKRK